MNKLLDKKEALKQITIPLEKKNEHRIPFNSFVLVIQNLNINFNEYEFKVYFSNQDIRS